MEISSGLCIILPINPQPNDLPAIPYIFHGLPRAQYHLPVLKHFYLAKERLFSHRFVVVNLKEKSEVMPLVFDTRIPIHFALFTQHFKSCMCLFIIKRREYSQEKNAISTVGMDLHGLHSCTDVLSSSRTEHCLPSWLSSALLRPTGPPLHRADITTGGMLKIRHKWSVSRHFTHVALFLILLLFLKAS